MTGLTTGRFSELYVKLPPDNEYQNVATVLTGLSGQNEDQAQIDHDLQDHIDGKQDQLTAMFPLRIEDSVISLGWLSIQDAANAAQGRAQHLMQTIVNTETIAELSAQVEANKVQVARLEADLAGLLAQQPASSKYISLNGETAEITITGGGRTYWTILSHGRSLLKS